MKKRRVKRRLKVGRLVLVIVLGIGLALGTYFGIRYLLKSNNDKQILIFSFTLFIHIFITYSTTFTLPLV